MGSKADIIFERRNPSIKAKEVIWQLIADSYNGGTDYANGNYLYQNAKESKTSFGVRKERAVYFNQTQPLADLLSGFLFMQLPERNDIGKQEYLLNAATSKKTSMDEFMKVTATHSLLYTCGVLVDSPEFDPEIVQTVKDRKDKGLNPYASLYFPFQIRDFYVGKDGGLDWVLLDNTYYDNEDPFSVGVEVKKYRLWTRDSFQDFFSTTDGITSGALMSHPLGEVPFRFVNWKDDNSDMITESVFEDPAMISKLIYNKLSEMDEMIAAGSFRVLMYPSTDGTIPEDLILGGIGSLSAIPFNSSSSKAPFFDGAKLEDVEPILKAIEFYISEILKKIGLDTDETKDYVKSGLAKQIDFQKVKTLLVSGSMALENLELWIFQTAAKWEGGESNAKVHYTTHYADEDIQVKVDLLSQLLLFPYKKLRSSVTNLIAKHLLTGELPQDELEEIYKEITAESDKVLQEELDLKKISVSGLANEESSDVNTDKNEESTTS